LTICDETVSPVASAMLSFPELAHPATTSEIKSATVTLAGPVMASPYAMCQSEMGLLLKERGSGVRLVEVPGSILRATKLFLATFSSRATAL